MKSFVVLICGLMLLLAAVSCDRHKYPHVVDASDSTRFLPPPTFKTFEPVEGQALTSVRINGTNFGNDPKKIVVLFGSDTATVDKVMPTEITVRVPSQARVGHIPIIVRVDTIELRSTAQFSVLFSPGVYAQATIEVVNVATKQIGQARGWSTGDINCQSTIIEEKHDTIIKLYSASHTNFNCQSSCNSEDNGDTVRLCCTGDRYYPGGISKFVELNVDWVNQRFRGVSSHFDVITQLRSTSSVKTTSNSFTLKVIDVPFVEQQDGALIAEIRSTDFAQHIRELVFYNTSQNEVMCHGFPRPYLSSSVLGSIVDQSNNEAYIRIILTRQ